MTDVLTKEQRSYNMSRIRDKWTKQETKIHNLLKGKKIKHEMHPAIEGSPDILIAAQNKAIFIDGCFWHRCPKCFKEPSSNTYFWKNKISRNVKKDKETNRKLKKAGYAIVRVWEHELKKKPEAVINKITSVQL